MKEIMIHGPIGSQVTAREVVEQFRQARGEEVLVRINSEGGSVLEGEAILTAIRQHDEKVYGQIDGYAFSMAGIIALALREEEGQGGLTMPENGFLMLHEVRVGAGGTVEDLERMLAQIKAMNSAIAAKVASAFSISEAEAAKRLKDEIWMNGAEALEAGIVSSLNPAEAMAAQFDVSSFTNMPKEFLAEVQVGKPTEDKADQPTNENKTTMKLFKLWNNDKAEPSLELAEIGPDDLGAELAEAQKSLDELVATHSAQLIARDEKHAQALQNALSEQEAELSAKHAEELAKKDEAIEAANNSSEEKANEILAQAGHSPVETTEPEERSIKEQYLALNPGEDRAKFRKEHAEELKDAFGSGALK